MDIQYRRFLHVAVFLILALLITRCSNDPAPQRDFGPSDLLIDLSVLPPHWEMRTPPRVPLQEENLTIGDSDDMSVVFSVKNGIPNAARHYVYSLSSTEEAERLYDSQFHLRFDGSFQPQALYYVRFC